MKTYNLNTITDTIYGTNDNFISGYSLRTGNSTQQQVALSKRKGYTETDSNPSGRWKWTEACVSDLIGCVGGMGTGLAVGGPFGAACGGLAFGLYESYKDYPRVINTGGGGGSVYNPTEGITISNNPYEFIGQIHNAGLFASLNTRLNNSIREYYEFERSFILQHLPEAFFSQFQLAYLSYSDFVRLDGAVHQQFRNDIVSSNPMRYIKTQSGPLFTPNFRTFWILNCGTLFNLNSANEVKEYYIALVDIITYAYDLTNEEKITMLACASLNTYSYLFHLLNSHNAEINNNKSNAY